MPMDLLTALPMPSPEETAEGVVWLCNAWKETTWEVAMTRAANARSNVNLCRFLQAIHSDNRTLSKNGADYPVAIFPAPERQWTRLESVLERPPDGGVFKGGREQWAAGLLGSGGKYLALLHHFGQRLWEDRTYRMVALKRGQEDELRLQCDLGWYFDAIETCDALEWELLTLFGQRNPAAEEFSEFAANLKLRRMLHKFVDDPVTDGKGRSAGVGVSTLVVFNAGNSYRLLVRERSTKGVAVHGGLIHVVPSFMFQPVLGDYDNEFSVTHNVFREYLEEVFGKPEVDRVPGAVRFDHFYGDPDLKYLVRLIEKGDASLVLTGVAVNLLNLRPEICTLLLIRSPDWYELHGDGRGGLSKVSVTGPEFRAPWEANSERMRALQNVTLDNVVESSSVFGPATTTPPGAAALWLGVDLAKRLLG